MFQNCKLVDMHAGGIRGHKIPRLLATHSTGRLYTVNLIKSQKAERLSQKES